MRCLGCEIHLIVRVVLRFNRKAVESMRFLGTLDSLQALRLGKYTKVVMIDREVPEFITKNGKTRMRGAIFSLIIDERLNDMQQRTINRVMKQIAKEIHSEDIDEGFIEALEPSNNFIDLVEEAEKRVAYTCKT